MMIKYAKKQKKEDSTLVKVLERNDFPKMNQVRSFVKESSLTWKCAGYEIVG